MGAEADPNPTAEDAPPVTALTTSRPAPGPDQPSSRDPNHSDDNTVRPKSNHLFQMAVFFQFQMAVVLTMLCVGPYNEVNDQMCAIIDICADRGVDAFFRMVPTTR